MTQLNYPFTLVPGQPENVNQLNSNLLAIQAVLNGNVDSGNIVSNSLPQSVLNAEAQAGMSDALQQGVIGANDGKVTYGSASGVNVAGGTAWVPTTSGILRRVTFTANSITVPVAGNTRLDQIVIDSTGLLTRVAGADSAGVTLDNRTGAAALPAGTIRLADLLITTAGVVNNVANIRDRRPWARGASKSILRTAGSFNTPTSHGLLDATGLQPRIECTGNPLKVKLLCRWQHNIALFTITFSPSVDGVTRGGVDTAYGTTPAASQANVTYGFYCEWEITPTAGSHLIGLMGGATSLGSILSTVADPLEFVIEESIRQNASND